MPSRPLPSDQAMLAGALITIPGLVDALGGLDNPRVIDLRARLSAALFSFGEDPATRDDCMIYGLAAMLILPLPQVLFDGG